MTTKAMANSELIIGMFVIWAEEEKKKQQLERCCWTAPSCVFLRMQQNLISKDFWAHLQMNVMLIVTGVLFFLPH